MPAEAKHKHGNYLFHLDATGEAGWYCGDCNRKAPGEPPGFRPDLDKDEIAAKVDSVLFDLNMHRFIYISNSTMGELICSQVVTKCKEEGRFDQYSILQFAFEVLAPEHSAFWKKIGDGCRAGKDPRERCWCGRLAKEWGQFGPSCSLKHQVDFSGRVKLVRRTAHEGQSELFSPDNPEDLEKNWDEGDSLPSELLLATGRNQQSVKKAKQK